MRWQCLVIRVCVKNATVVQTPRAAHRPGDSHEASATGRVRLRAFSVLICVYVVDGVRGKEQTAFLVRQPGNTR